MIRQTKDLSSRCVFALSAELSYWTWNLVDKCRPSTKWWGSKETCWWSREIYTCQSLVLGIVGSHLGKPFTLPFLITMFLRAFNGINTNHSCNLFICQAYVNNIDFDYMEYARGRFKQYWLRKPELLGTSDKLSHVDASAEPKTLSAIPWCQNMYINNVERKKPL